MGTEDDAFARGLAAFLGSASVFDRPVPVEVPGYRRLSGGASRETFSVEVAARDGGQTTTVIVQRVRTGALSAAFSMEAEGRLIMAAQAAGVPVAEVIAASDDPAHMGAPFTVSRFVTGETIARRILRDDDLAPAREVLVRQCAEALARIHTIDPGVVPELRHDPDPLGQLRALFDSLGQAQPAFELAFRWLARTARPADGAEPTVVHGDFRLGNLIVGREGLAAVVDWELPHVGDPLEDLGWLCVRAWRFGAAEPVAGLGSREELFAAYVAAGGRAVDPEAARWWEVFGNLRWGVICILQAQTHLKGFSRSVELAAIGRRVCETEYDLLALLAPDDPSANAPDSADDDEETARADAPSMHDAPSAADLVEAVREFLERDVMGATDGRVQFHTRVSLNVLGMVERELRLGPAFEALHEARLAALGFRNDVDLAAGIRDGEVDDRIDEVTTGVFATVRDKLRVANPGYVDVGQ